MTVHPARSFSRWDWNQNRVLHCRGRHNTDRRLALQSSREDLVPRRECRLGSELGVDDPQCREKWQYRWYRLGKASQIEIRERELEHGDRIRFKAAARWLDASVGYQPLRRWPF